MRNVENIARYVVDKFLNTKDFEAIVLTSNTQRVYIGLKQEFAQKQCTQAVKCSDAAISGC